ncbi:hypothetical protein ACFYMO_03875 [Streptomyces sp. NPDC007025]|uniref:hypothetical protein n=1 Tax=Streptomyces sp. NPDC007025 TaxID=3364771 RepID=UPI0036D1296A
MLIVRAARAYYRLNVRAFSAIKRSVEWVPPIALMAAVSVGYLGFMAGMKGAGHDTTVFALVACPLFLALGMATGHAHVDRVTRRR